MAVILVKPTDTTSPTYQAMLDQYNTRIDGVRIKASPDITTRISEELLPSSVIENDVYMRSAERQVLKSVNMTAADVESLDKTSDTFLDLVVLMQIRLAINVIPQLPQVINEVYLQDSSRYQTVNWDKRIEELKAEFSDIIEDIVPDAPATGSVRTKTLLSRSRADD